MKKQRYIALFSLSLVLVLLAPASVVLRIALDQSQGKRAARENFARLTALLAPVTRASDLSAPGLRKDLERFYASSPSLLLVSVYERDSGVRWRIPARSDYLPARENEAAIPQPSYPPQSAYLLAAPLSSDISGRLAVDALYSVLPQQAVFVAFRDAALGLGLLLVILLFVILLDPTRTRGQPVPSPDEEACAEDPSLEGCDSIYSSPLDDDFDIPALSPEVEARLPEEESLESKARDAAAGGGPGGLFSPLSGLGWESYLEARLDSELSRSASFEQDLSLLLILQDGLSPDKAAYLTLAGAIGDFFSFRDLAFERGPDGFAVILPNIDAEHGLRMAEEFLRKATALLPGGSPNPIFMGLSSRAGRLVDAARLGHEAGAALERAKTEAGSHIVAFRPDPDRYRIYLASKNL